MLERKLQPKCLLAVRNETVGVALRCGLTVFEWLKVPHKNLLTDDARMKELRTTNVVCLRVVMEKWLYYRSVQGEANFPLAPKNSKENRLQLRKK